MLRRGCGRQAITDCVYCARPFCEEHGERGDQYMDVCVRRHCQEKLRDVRAHEQWKRRVEVSNAVSVCADEECNSRLRHQCSRCRLLFCEAHVEERRVRDFRARPAIDVLALVCAHCHGRRKLWD
jgi:hypothetical protein